MAIATAVANFVSSPPSGQIELQPEEWDILRKRRKDVVDYVPPMWRSNFTDSVSGVVIEKPMVKHANIVFIGPVGSGKSSLIGSLYRAVNEEAEFPEKVSQVLHHPDIDTHGTVQWLETRGNPMGTIVFQDTRGDQEYDASERSIHEQALQGVYRDGAALQSSFIFTKEWWLSQRFFWERNLSEVPHCVVFVFDGSKDPFLESKSLESESLKSESLESESLKFESLEFFKNVFKDCTKMGYEPVIVITCLDLIYQEAIRMGKNFDTEMQERREKVLHAFEKLNLIRQSIYFVTNFHEGRRGGVKVWVSEDSEFDKATKVMVNLARDLLALSDRFIERKYTGSCSIF